MPTPGNYVFQLYQGQTWRNTLRLRDSAGDPVVLTGYTARMQIRPSVDSDTVLLELTTENGRLTINGAAGEISILVAAAVMEALPLDYETVAWVYDLEIISGDATPVVTRVLQGAVMVTPEVTRAD